MHKLLLFFSIILAQLGLATEEPATEFIRVHHTENSINLQTAVTTYSKDQVSVDLIGAVHIADKKYFQGLNATFKKYPVLLFEMVGGENIGKEKQADAAAKKGGLDLLGSVYSTMEKMLQLSGQKTHIDYQAKNFVHADLTLKEFYDLQEKRGESLLSFAFKQAMNQENTKAPNTMKLLSALLSNNPDKIKLQLVETLGQGDNQIAQMTGENVIISDRNAKCLKVMQQQIDAGQNKIGIFYGAAHYPDMEKRLLKMGYKKTQHRWINAWVIDKKKAGIKKKAVVEDKKAA